MFFYALLLLLISSLLLLGYFYPDKEKALGIIVLCIMILVSGFRDTIGSDYKSYVNWYLYKTRDDDLEFGFVAIMNLLRWLNLSPPFLFFFFSFFTCFFLFLGVKKYTVNSNLALLFYILIPSLYLTSFTLVRQSFSVAISFYAFYYLINKKYLVYFLLMFIGISIHISCLIPFIVFFLVFRYADKINLNHLYGLLVISFILSRFDFIQIFRGLFEKSRYLYYFSEHFSKVSFFKIIVMNLEGFLVIFYFQKLKNKYPYQQYLIILYCLSIVFVNLLSKNHDFTRISTFFRVFEIVVLADLVFLQENRKRIVFFTFFYFLYFAAFFNGLKKDSEIPVENMPKFVPYKNILWSLGTILNDSVCINKEDFEEVIR